VASHRITYSHNLICEGPSNSVHDKGEHSKGSLIHDHQSVRGEGRSGEIDATPAHMPSGPTKRRHFEQVTNLLSNTVCC